MISGKLGHISCSLGDSGSFLPGCSRIFWEALAGTTHTFVSRHSVIVVKDCPRDPTLALLHPCLWQSLYPSQN